MHWPSLLNAVPNTMPGVSSTYQVQQACLISKAGAELLQHELRTCRVKFCVLHMCLAMVTLVALVILLDVVV